MSTPRRGSLAPFDLTDPEQVSVYDELPLWSAPFGLSLLDAVEMHEEATVLDVGHGTGFPLLELAQRLGPKSRVYGVDPWAAANDRVRVKLGRYGVTNVEIVEGGAEELPFADGFFSLVVSNNGINNVQDPRRALSECFRVCRRGAQIVLTMNLPDSMQELYQVFAELLRETGREALLGAMHEHIASRRKPRSETEAMLREAGFRLERVAEERFRLRYSSGTALLGHYFVRLAFLDSWKSILPPGEVASFFGLLEERLNQRAAAQGGFQLTIPYLCIDGKKP
jgi:ubiquinone/menaquinone biosynthesis C-methylase UbiE